MARYPGAVWRPITASKGRGSLTVYNRVNLHVTASNATSQFGYFNQSGIPDSHFHIAKDGTVEQYVDTSKNAFADLDGNDATISIETQGLGDESWTAAQREAIAQVTAWAMETHDIPQKMASNSKVGSSSKGLSWHRLGIDGNFPSLPSIQAGRLQRGGGMHYSSHFGKVCPGNLRVAQIPAIWTRVQAIIGTSGTGQEGGFLMGLSDAEQQSVLWNVREIKEALDTHVAEPVLWNARQTKEQVDLIRSDDLDGVDTNVAVTKANVAALQAANVELQGAVDEIRATLAAILAAVNPPPAP